MALLLCQSVGKLCSNVCECLVSPCQQCCTGLCEAVSSPFLPYRAVTFALNLPAVFWAFYALNKDYAGCDRTWLFVNGVFCILHIFASGYIIHKIEENQEAVVVAEAQVVEEGATTDYKGMDNKPQTAMPKVFERFMPSENGEAKSWQRLSQVLCYDAGVAVYIVIAVMWIVWQSMGFSQALFGEDPIEACAKIGSWQLYEIVLGFIYMMLVGCAFACSFICLR